MRDGIEEKKFRYQPIRQSVYRQSGQIPWGYWNRFLASAKVRSKGHIKVHAVGIVFDLTASILINEIFFALLKLKICKDKKARFSFYYYFGTVEPLVSYWYAWKIGSFKMMFLVRE